MRVLVAEDDRGTVRIIRSLLVEWGFEVETAADGEKAWAILSQPNCPQLVLLDWLMPGLEGPEICRRLRRLVREGYVYVILVTSRSRKEDVSVGLEAGADDYLMKPFAPEELRARLRVGERIIAFSGELLAANNRLRTLALTDELTGLVNHGAVKMRLGEEHARHGRTNLPLSVLMLDIDLFKAFNDTCGHALGDSVLKAVARSLKDGCRPYDVVGRYGGDEFLLLLPATDLEQAHYTAQRLRHIVAHTPVPFGRRKLRVTVSIGVAILEEGKPDSPEALLKAADTALYRAKVEGRNRVNIAIEQDYQPAT